MLDQVLVGLLLRLVGRLIATENEALVRADAAHERELADDAAPRKARDEAVEKVRRILVDLRAAVETTCGMAGLPRLHLLEAVPTDPSVLATIGLAWLFVLLRVGHSAIHCTYNKVMHRFYAYVAGGVALWLLWGAIALGWWRG